MTLVPVEGQANSAVEQLLARTLGVKIAAVSVVRGERGRDKVMRVASLTPAEIDERLERGRSIGG